MNFPNLPNDYEILFQFGNNRNNLLKIVDTITSEQESLSELIQTTKSKILDLAIRGKLLPKIKPKRLLQDYASVTTLSLLQWGKLPP